MANLSSTSRPSSSMIKCQQRQALMLLSSSLPPQFLLPSWTTPQLLRQLRQYSNWEEERGRAQRQYELQQLRNEFRKEAEISQGKVTLQTSVKSLDRSTAKSRSSEPAALIRRYNSAPEALIRRTTYNYNFPGTYSWIGGTSISENGRDHKLSTILDNKESVFKESGYSNDTDKLQNSQRKGLKKNSRERCSDGKETGAASASGTTDTYQSQTSQSFGAKRPRENDRQNDSSWTNRRSDPNHGQPHINWKPAEDKALPFKPVRELSLFEELFPEESDKEITGKKIAQEGWFPISDTPTKDSGFPSLDEVQRLSSCLSQPPKRRGRHTLKGSNDILILSCASKNLEESDFLRLNPKGTHIEGWASGMMKVIPGRNPHTLVPNGSYIIIFPSSYHATAYKESLLNAHRAAQMHTPQSLSSPLSPPPTQHHAPNAELLKIYTLFPPAQRSLSIQKPSLPFKGQNLQKIVSDGGYEAILHASETPTGQKAGLVLFSIIPPVEGLRSLQGLKAFLERDGRARNLAWRLAGDENGYSNGREVIRRVVGTEMENRNKWILSFKDVNEARRFVRVWHRRELGERKWREGEAGMKEKERERKMSWEGVGGLVEEEEPVVSAELLW